MCKNMLVAGRVLRQDLDSLSTLETRDPATACVDSEASSSTSALGKALSVVASRNQTIRRL